MIVRDYIEMIRTAIDLGNVEYACKLLAEARAIVQPGDLADRADLHDLANNIQVLMMKKMYTQLG